MSRRKRRSHRPHPGRVLALCALAILLSAAFGAWQFATAKPAARPAGLSQNSPSADPSPSPLPLPDSTDAAQTDGDWRLLLVNKWTPIPDGYPLVPEGTTTLSNGEQVDSRIYPDLQTMFDDMRADGVYPMVASGYRTRAVQQQFWDDKVTAFMNEGRDKDAAETETSSWVAKPGCSEHELGLAVDINGDGAHSDNTAVYDWLAANGYRYGFIYRYPPDKGEQTGGANEPWHYRYVGREAAAAMQESGQCLEEYLAG